MQRGANSVTRRIRRTRNRSIRETRSDHQVAVVQRIGDERARFISHQSFRPAQVVKKRNHLVEIAGSLVIDDRYATEIETVISRDAADGFIISQHGNTRDTPARSFSRSDNGARIVSLGKHDVLRP